MATVQQLIDAVNAQETKIASLTTLIGGLKQQIADILTGATIPPAVQAKIDELFTEIEQNTAALDAALADNSPPA